MISRWSARPEDIDPAPLRAGWRNVALTVLLVAASVALLVWSVSFDGESAWWNVGRLVSVLCFYALMRWGYYRPRRRRGRDQQQTGPAP